MLNDFDIDYASIVKSRIKRLREIRKDDKNLQACKVVYQTDCIKFINDWFITYDPRKTPANRPFILYPKQEEFLNWVLDRYKNKEDGLLEKSRDMGASWLCMAFALWMWIFIPSSKIAFGSWKENKIDRIGDNDSIFEKGRMILRNIPREFLPTNFREEKDATFLKFINRDNGSTITGEAGDQIGRGGRSGIYFKDESAFYERPEKVESALSQNTDVQIDVSTPNGNGNLFYQKRISGKVPVFTLHWRDHPLKDDEWYQKQKARYSPIIVAQEIDIDYNASVEDVCIPMRWIQSAVNLELPKEGNKRAGLDVADEGKDKNAICMAHGVVVTGIESWGYGNTTETARAGYNKCKQNDINELRFDSIGVGAGIKGEMSVIDMGLYKLDVYGVNVGTSPTDGQLEPGKDNKDMFMNLKAELWWSMRRRFEKTYEHVNNIRKYNIDDMISIPNDAELINELSQPKYQFGENGKMKIESKKDMLKRGIKSPNKADALMLCFSKSGATVVIDDFSMNTVDSLY